MGIVECPKCENTFLAPREEQGNQKLCSTCHVNIQRKMNKADREYTMKDDQRLSDDEYSEKFERMHEKKVRRINHLLKGIPPSLIPSNLAQMAEEIKDPEIKDRTFCIGRLDEVQSTGNGVELKERYQS